jgi:hypothetical protein
MPALGVSSEIKGREKRELAYPWQRVKGWKNVLLLSFVKTSLHGILWDMSRMYLSGKTQVLDCQTVTTINYSAIANSHALQFIMALTKSSVSSLCAAW